jgi:UDP-3-O-[3-hydroxymyristoyl] glucosamine N-acyltransferase
VAKRKRPVFAIAPNNDSQLKDYAISAVARIGNNTHISNSTIGDSAIGDGAKVINSNVGNDTNVGARTFVLGSDLGEFNEIGADSSVASSEFGSKKGHTGILDHVSIAASKIGSDTFIGSYTGIHNSEVEKLCSFAGHSLVINSRIGKGSHIGELFDARGVTIIEEAMIGNDVAIMQDSVLMSRVHIGDGTRIAVQVTLDDDVAVHRNVTIGAQSKIGQNAVIEDGVVIGAGVHIFDGAHIGKDCIIGDGAFIGDGVNVEEGTVLPKKCVITTDGIRTTKGDKS